VINSEANRQASWDWEYSSDQADQADPLGGPINREADYLYIKHRKNSNKYTYRIIRLE
jgi:hypothetical protein